MTHPHCLQQCWCCLLCQHYHAPSLPPLPRSPAYFGYCFLPLFGCAMKRRRQRSGCGAVVMLEPPRRSGKGSTVIGLQPRFAGSRTPILWTHPCGRTLICAGTPADHPSAPPRPAQKLLLYFDSQFTDLEAICTGPN